MSEQNNHDGEHDGHEDHPAGHAGHGHLHAFAIPLGAAMEAVDQQDQRAEVWGVRIDNFMDSLTVDQKLVLRKILNMDASSAWNMYFDGQLSAMLRLVDHVNPDSGEPDFPQPPQAKA